MKTLKEALFSRKNINKGEDVIFEFENKDKYFTASKRQRYIVFDLYCKKRNYAVFLEKNVTRYFIEDVYSGEDSDYYVSEIDNDIMLCFVSGNCNNSYIEFQDDSTGDYDKITISDGKIIELYDNLESYINTHNIK